MRGLDVYLPLAPARGQTRWQAAPLPALVLSLPKAWAEEMLC